jgi:AcrR family transcriptional regulator
MAKEHTGDDDPRRSIELLWGVQEPGKRGPKPRFSTDDVVQAAIALADRDGLSAISMRSVARAVGVSPMAVYTYVRSKNELLALMYDRVLGEGEQAPPGLAWRDALEFMARGRWDLAQRHPWLLGLALHRPPLGPNLMTRVEAVMGALEGCGLTEIEKDLLVDVLHNYIEGALNEAGEAREAEQRSGLTDEQWVAIVEPALQARLDPDRFPHLIRLGEAWREQRHLLTDPRHRFEQGLQVVLDGIGAFIARRQAGG